MYSVAVLMSTYNGERYIREQIESVFKQEGVVVSLFIRDDGSSDNTLDIIREYIEKGNNIALEQGKNVGVGNSFMDLVYCIEDGYDYYAFADQDDVWLPQKIMGAIKKLQYKIGPSLYCSNQILVDKYLNRIGMRFDEIPDMSYKQIMCKNLATGCTMVWNKQLQNILSNPIRRPTNELLRSRIHDVWVAMVASIVGEIIYDESSYILYRQHENNVVGSKRKTMYGDIKDKVSKLFNASERKGRSLLAKELYEKYNEYASNHSLIIYSAQYKKLKLLSNMKQIKKYSKETTIGLALKIIMGFY